VICQDALYEKVAKAGVVIDLLVVTNVGEYLPAFKPPVSRGRCELLPRRISCRIC